MQRRRMLAFGLAAIGAWAVPAGVVLAGNSSSGGGATPAGTVYFTVTTSTGSTSILSMDGAGGDVRTLSASVPTTPGANLRASRLLHGGRRWFLAREAVPGEAGVHGASTRFDLFAVREDGAVNVRLTSDPTMDYDALVGRACWAPDESAGGATISVTARRWTGTTSSATVVPGSAGLYTAHLSFDGSGDVAGLDAAPAFLVSLGTTVNGGGEKADVRLYSWSPDMTRVVCDRLLTPRSDLRVVNVSSGAVTTIATGQYLSEPDWSPDGAKIACVWLAGAKAPLRDSIATMSPTGANFLVAYTSPGNDTNDWVILPRWSPDSVFIAFDEQRAFQGMNPSIYRIAASGGSATLLRTDGASRDAIADWR